MSLEAYRQTVLAWTRGELRDLRLQYETDAEAETDPERQAYRLRLATATRFIYGSVASWDPEDRVYADMEDVTVQDFLDATLPDTARDPETDDEKRAHLTGGAVNNAALAIQALAEEGTK